ncbi:MAG: tRNA (guanosine(46)-N7)-methyltransferase TrmB [Clostridiales bacterium]|nr:MAG: tRNA (guanosine(46)-N7)-methyltransferase TrmB [Clostridiales bacterium]
MRRRRVAGAMAAFLAYPQYALLADQDCNQKLRQFADDDVLNVEVGSGRGGYLVQMAARYPERKFVGIELKEELLMTAVRKAAAAEVDNLLFICGYAEHFADWFSGITVDTLYLNFIDPWPKRRNAVKRLSHRNYLKLYCSAMVPGSRLILKTDNRHLYLFSFVEFKRFFTIVSTTQDLVAVGDDTNVATEYETRFSAQGKPIYRIVCQIDSEQVC